MADRPTSATDVDTWTRRHEVIVVAAGRHVVDGMFWTAAGPGTSALFEAIPGGPLEPVTHADYDHDRPDSWLSRGDC